jgi:hypothetical protein
MQEAGRRPVESRYRPALDVVSAVHFEFGMTNLGRTRPLGKVAGRGSGVQLACFSVVGTKQLAPRRDS